MISFEGELFFSASENVEKGKDVAGLYKSDGTRQGTVPVHTNTNVKSFKILGRVNDRLFYYGEENEVESLYVYSSKKSFVVKNSGISSMYYSIYLTTDNLLFFVNDTKQNGRELWRSDGTPQGTFMVKDILTGKDASDPRDLIDVNGMLFFTSETYKHGRVWWKSDGTEQGTQIASIDNQRATHYYRFADVNGQLVSWGGFYDGTWKLEGDKFVSVTQSTTPFPAVAPPKKVQPNINSPTVTTPNTTTTDKDKKLTKIDSLAYYRTNLQQTQTELQTAQQTLQQTEKSLQDKTAENATQATKIAEQASDIATKTQQIKDLEAKIASLETQLEKTERELERERMNLFAGFKNFSFYEKPEQEEPEENIPRAKNIQAIEFQYYFSRELTKDDIVVLKIGEYATIPLDEQSLRTLNYNRLRHKFVKGTFQVEKDKPTEIEVRILHTNAKYDIKDQEVGKMLLRFYR